MPRKNAKRVSAAESPSVTIKIDVTLNHMDDPPPDLLNELFKALGQIRVDPKRWEAAQCRAK